MCAGSAHWALIVARGWLVFDLTGSSGLVGAVTFAAMIPRFLISPFAGLLADRVDRRILLAWAFGINITHNLVLAILTVVSFIEVWHLVALSFVNGSARAFQMPASGSLLPNLVPREYLLNAIALNSATLHGTRLFGPLMTGPLLAISSTAFGPGIAFFLCCALYLVGLIVVSSIGTVSRGSIQVDKGIIDNLLAGLKYVYRDDLLRPLIILVAVHCALTMSFESLLPVLASEQLGAKGSGFGYMMMAVGAGAIIGVACLTVVTSEYVRGRLLLTSGIVSGLAPALLAISPSMPMALLAAMLMGLSQGCFMTLFTTIVQSVVPDSIRGRVTSINNLHIGGIMAAFNLVNGSLADISGAPIILICTGLAFTILMPITLANKSLRTQYG